MPVFRWQGLSVGGQTVQGEMEAPSRAAVLAQLRSQRINPVPGKIKEKGTGLSLKIPLPSFAKDKVKERDLVIFTRQLAAMLRAGLPILEALGALSTQSTSKPMREALARIKDDVEAGTTLTAAMRNHPRIFQEIYLATIAAGEVGGVLDDVLPRLASSIEKSAKLKGKIKGAMIYPAAISVVAVGVTAVLLIFVIPAFGDMFSELGQTLPLPTQLVINLSNATIAWARYAILVILAVACAGRYYYRTDTGRLVIDQFLLQAPLIGDLVQKSTVARVMHTLGTLIASGTPILDALDIAARTAGNRVIRRALNASRTAVSEGRKLTEPLTQSKVFPPLVCQMVAVGEATSALDTMLQEVAKLYEEEVDNAVANLTSLMEPILMVFLSIVIGGLLIAMYLPIFKLGAALG